jgi:uncharacterized membrane protein
VLAAVLALASSLSWGFSDFLGGFQSWRVALLAVLARFVLHERLTRAQGVGVAITLAGVIALAAG